MGNVGRMGNARSHVLRPLAPMRVIRWLLVLGMIVGSGACSRTWTNVDVYKLRAGRQREPLFVITTGAAYVLEDARVASDSVGGTPISSWEFPFDPEFTVYTDDTPDTIANRLGWKRSLRVDDHVEIKLSLVRYVSSYRRGSEVGARIVKGTLAGLLIVGLVGLVVVFFSSACCL